MTLSQEENWLKSSQALLERELDCRLPAASQAPVAMHEALRYAVLNGGKRLRPVFSLTVAEVAGAAPGAVMDAACAVEFIHTASLILDDLPCMDDSKERRGKPCLHLVWDEATAVLSAMALLSAAYALAAENAIRLERPETGTALNRLIHRAVGTEGLIHGQHLDLSYTGRKASLDALTAIHRHKASALFLLSLEMPARLLGMPDNEIQQLRIYGENLGLAFQIADDLRDENEDPEDLLKSSFSTHLGRAGARENVCELLEKAVDALGIFGGRAARLRQLAEYVGS
jgi:geranylgeranyl pyrophosphate synthase